MYSKSVPCWLDLRVLPNERTSPWWNLKKKWTKPARDYFETLEPLKVVLADGSSFIIPKGFKTDLASIPRALRSVISVCDSHMVAAVIHDYLYRDKSQAFRGRKEADKIFRQIMKDIGVGRIKRNTMYAGVRVGGWGSYQKG